MRRLRNSTFPRNRRPDSGPLAFAQFTTSLLTDSGQALKERERLRRDYRCDRSSRTRSTRERRIINKLIKFFPYNLGSFQGPAIAPANTNIDQKTVKTITPKV